MRVIVGYGLFETDDDFFWSESLMKRMVHLDKKRDLAKKAALSRWSKQAKNEENNADAMRTQCGRNATRNANKGNKGNKGKKESGDSGESLSLEERPKACNQDCKCGTNEMCKVIPEKHSMFDIAYIAKLIRIENFNTANYFNSRARSNWTLSNGRKIKSIPADMKLWRSKGWA